MDLVCKISKSQFVTLMKRYEYNKWSDAALETIYDLECEIQEGLNGNVFIFDHPSLRGAYSEYDSVEEAIKDLCLDSEDELYETHRVRKTNSGSIVLY